MSKRDLEAFFIAPFASVSGFVGDDAAVVEKRVYSKDAFVEGTHFLRRWMTPAQIACKAMAVNISDAVAMNARPKYVLLAVGLPRDYTREEAGELARGFVEAARRFGCEIIGGDTVRSDRLCISVTVVSETARPLRRTGIRSGDLIAYTGSVGKAGKELRYLLSGRTPHAKMHFMCPVLRGAFVADAAPYLSAGMDISDGIFTDLQRLAEANRIGFGMLSPLPRALGCSGEEYEMLVAFSPRQRRHIERLARRRRVRLTVFARAARTRYRNPCKSHHF